MTLDEAIENAEEKAEEIRNEAEHYEIAGVNVYGCEERAQEWEQFAEWLKELKLLREQTRWIPVNERTPEDRRTVLVTAYWHETYQVMMGSYYGDGLWWCVPYNNCGKHMQKLNPKAWTPLPESYKSKIPTGSEGSDKVNCDKTECYDCVNHGCCDYETESEEV